MSDNWWRDWEATFNDSSWYRDWHEDPRNNRGTPLSAAPANCQRIRYDNHGRLLVTVPNGAHQGSDFGLDFRAKGSTVLPETLMWRYDIWFFPDLPENDFPNPWQGDSFLHGKLPGPEGITGDGERSGA